MKKSIKQIITPTQLARRWKVAEGTLANWRSQGRGPKYFKAGRRVRYNLKHIESFESVSMN
jgi:hypothetical protein